MNVIDNTGSTKESVVDNADFSTETKVTVESSNRMKILNGLFDSGASWTHIKHRALRNIQYTSNRVIFLVKCQYTKSMIRERVEF